MSTENEKQRQQSEPLLQPDASELPDLTQQPDPADTAQEPDSRSEEQRLTEEYRLMGEEAPQSEEDMGQVLDRLSTFYDTPAAKNRARGKAPRQKFGAKRRMIILALVIAAVAGIAVWGLFLRNDGEQTDEVITTRATYRTEDLLPGEALSGGDEGYLYLFAPQETDAVQSIRWHNAEGDFAFYRADTDEFVLEGSETLSYDQESFSLLVAATCRVSALRRVTTKCDNFGEYGLDGEGKMSFTVTSKSGAAYTVYLGDKLPTNAAYYARFAGRDALYILSAEYLDGSVACSAVSMITPLLVYPVPENQYYLMDNFTLLHDGELMMRVESLDEDEREALATTRLFRMTYPADYTPSSDRYDSIVLINLTQLTGEKAVAKLPDKSQTEALHEVLGQYGCYPPKHEISYTYDGVDVYLMVSDRVQIDGVDYYYVASDLFGIIATVPADTLEFLEWDLIDYIERPIFFKNVKDIDTIALKSRDGTVNANFKLTHLADGKDENSNLQVRETVSGTPIANVANFRNFYRVLLTRNIEDYAAITQADVTEADCELTVTITTLAGVEIVYRFYPYSTRRTLYTINGKGEFYLLQKNVQKLMDDCNRVIQGLTVDAEAKS